MDETLLALLERNDPLLADVLKAQDDIERGMAMDVLVEEQVRPLAARIIARFRRSEPLAAEEADDLESLVMLRLIRRLQLITQGPEHAVAELENYVASLAYRTLYDLRRERFPERTRLKNRLRYVLTHTAHLALWPSEGGLLAGLAAWRGTHSFTRSFGLSDIAVTTPMLDSANPARAVTALLTAKGAAVPFDMLVGAVAHLWNTRDTAEIARSAPAPAHDPLTDLEGRQYLGHLWREITALPQNQRGALLLNLRDLGGANALTLFLLLGVATLQDVAVAIGVSSEELTSIWDDLPLDDLAIAAKMSMTRQQVINLRKAARARLARRMDRMK
jgi:hypothetical protein